MQKQWHSPWRLIGCRTPPGCPSIGLRPPLHLAWWWGKVRSRVGCRLCLSRHPLAKGSPPVGHCHPPTSPIRPGNDMENQQTPQGKLSILKLLFHALETLPQLINTFRHEQNGHYFTDDIVTCIPLMLEIFTEMCFSGSIWRYHIISVWGNGLMPSSNKQLTLSIFTNIYMPHGITKPQRVDKLLQQQQVLLWKICYHLIHKIYCHLFYLLWPSDATWGNKSGSTLAHVKACCQAAPGHYLNQSWPRPMSPYGTSIYYLRTVLGLAQLLSSPVHWYIVERSPIGRTSPCGMPLLRTQQPPSCHVSVRPVIYSPRPPRQGRMHGCLWWPPPEQAGPSNGRQSRRLQENKDSLCGCQTAL